jgi:hypothetical protein
LRKIFLDEISSTCSRRPKDSVFVAILATIFYSSYVFLPHYTWRLLVLCGVLPPPEGATIDDVLLMPGSPGVHPSAGK